MKTHSLKKDQGMILVTVVIFAGIAALMIAALTGWFVATIKVSKDLVDREQAFQIAEAGVEYYRWHLLYAPTDYQDGTATSGPYVHNYYDKDGNFIGTFTLTITPPPVGSTKVSIMSEGQTASDSIETDTIDATYAIPSFAQYAVVANDNLNFGAGTVVSGPVMSNYGIQFDGLAQNIVSSAVSSYYDPDYSGTYPQFGVYTRVDPPPATGTDMTDDYIPAESPPEIPTARNDVFQSGRVFPVPAVDFSGLTINLAQLQALAQSYGGYFPPSGAEGYDVLLNTNNTFTLYKVTTLTPAPSDCTNTANQANWGTWSINTETIVGTYAIPSNGIIFLADNVWVRGQIDGSRVTIVAATLPDDVATQDNITINNSLTYTNFNATDTIGLIAQNNINIGLYSDDNLTIDAALIAQNGRVGRFYYPPTTGSNGCYPYATRGTLNLLGMIASNLQYGFDYTDNTGYLTRDTTYDANLLPNPPPSFPLSPSGQYQLISWENLDPQ